MLSVAKRPKNQMADQSGDRERYSGEEVKIFGHRAVWPYKVIQNCSLAVHEDNGRESRDGEHAIPLNGSIRTRGTSSEVSDRSGERNQAQNVVANNHEIR